MKGSRHAYSGSLEPEISKEASPAKLDLTVGIEIECALLCSETTVGNSQVARNVIYEALSAPAQVCCASCGELHEVWLPILPVAGTRGPVHHHPNDLLFERWAIGEDSTIGIEKEEKLFPGAIKYKYDLEIRSRILSLGHPHPSGSINHKTGCKHTISYDNEIRMIYAALNKINSPDSTTPLWRIVINETCSTHVHVGNYNRSFPLQTVKNTVAIVIANEKALDAIHATNRIDGSILGNTDEATQRSSFYRSNDEHCWKLPSSMNDKGKDEDEAARLEPQTSSYNMPWSSHFAGIAYCRRRDVSYGTKDKSPPYPDTAMEKIPTLKQLASNNDIPSWLAVIEHASSLIELKELQKERHKHSTLNLFNLGLYNDEGYDMRETDKKLTLEFRQLAGTLDVEEVLAWVDLTAYIVQTAHCQSYQTIRQDFCEPACKDPEWDTMQLLGKLGYVPNDGGYAFYQRVLGYVDHQELPGAEEDDDAGDDNGSIASFATAVQILTNSSQYSHDQVTLASLLPSSDPLKPILLHAIAGNAARRSTRAVRERMWMKFLKGCYGQFEWEFLEGVKFDGHELNDEQTVKLTKGWVPKFEESD